MRLLVTGASGFVGGHALNHFPESVPLPRVDLRDYEGLRRILGELEFDAVLHLAAQSHVPTAWKDPSSTYAINFLGTAHLLQALGELKFKGDFLMVSSGSVYGKVPESALPLRETTPPRPIDPYAVSKRAAEEVALFWARTGPFKVVISRAFNHVGRGQADIFVLPTMAHQIAEQEKAAEVHLKVGDLEVTRDFLPVSEVLRAYEALLKKGRSGEIYHVASGRERSVREVVERLAEFSTASVTIEVETSRLREIQQARMVASVDKIREHTGWEPDTDLDEVLQQVLDEWRTRCRKEP